MIRQDVEVGAILEHLCWSDSELSDWIMKDVMHVIIYRMWSPVFSTQRQRVKRVMMRFLAINDGLQERRARDILAFAPMCTNLTARIAFILRTHAKRAGSFC